MGRYYLTRLGIRMEVNEAIVILALGVLCIVGVWLAVLTYYVIRRTEPKHKDSKTKEEKAPEEEAPEE